MEPIRSLESIRVGLEVLVSKDERLARILSEVDEVPLRLSEPGFAGLSRIIIGQQVSTASATAIHGRFTRMIQPLTADAYLAAGEEVWKKIGLSRPKQRAMLALCEAIHSHAIDLDTLHENRTTDALDKLTAIKGIGPWTAEVYLLFGAGHPDIFPAGDLALQEAVKVALDLPERPSDARLREIANQWSPWRGVAARLFWAYYRTLKKGREGI